MNSKALHSLSYGVFLLCTKAGEKGNGCITNTCMQVASNPTKIAFAVLNRNYTCDLLKESGVFSITVLDKSCNQQTIAHFGLQSGRNVDKFAGVTLPVDANGIPHLGGMAVSYISGKVTEQVDLGSHTLFIAEVTEAEVLGDKEPMTYAYYQAEVKPKPEVKKDERKPIAWKCKICGYVYKGAELPAEYNCPLCSHPADDFEPIYE